MPLFYLHIRDAEELVEDTEGIDLPDLDAARSEAVRGARDIIASAVRAGGLLDGQRIEITDAEGRLLASVPFKDVIRIA